MPKQFISSAGSSAQNEPRLLSQKKLSGFLLLATEWLMLAAVAIIPLVFLTATSQAQEFPKQIALMVIVSLAILCWVGSMLVNKALSFRRSVANPIVLILLVATAVSAFVSEARYVGIVGDGGQEYQSLVTTALFTAFFFAVVNISDRRRFAPRAIFVATIVGGLVSLLALFQFAGVHLIPGATAATFNLVGSTVVLGLYAAVTVVMASTSFLAEMSEGKLALAKRIIIGFLGVCALALAAVIDFWPIWIAIIVGLIVVLALATVRPQAIRRLGWLTVPMVALVISVLLLVVNVPLPVRPPTEVFPSLKQSFSVARDTLFAHPLFGTGPGTFDRDFALHRGTDLNKSPLWYVQFDRGTSYLSTVAATLGLFGLVAWLAIIVVGIWKSAAYLIVSRKKDEANWVMSLGIAVAWLASAAGLVFYGASLASLFLFWFLFALLIRSTSSTSAEVGFESSPRTGLSMTFIFVILIVLSLAGWFVCGTRLYADVAFSKAITTSIDTKIDVVIADIERSSDMNPRSDIVMRNLSQAYLIKVRQLVNDATIDNATRGSQVQSLTSSAIKAAQSATTLSPNSSQNWSQLGAVYEAIMSYVTNASDEALKSYSRAAELDPFSPVHHTGLGRVYLSVASKASALASSTKDETAKAEAQKNVATALASAATELNKALELKSDYAPASYQLALVLDGQGKIKEAIVSLEKIAQANADDLGVGFEMAMLYYRDNQKEKAQAVLENLVKLSPNFANARWSLATVYEDQKNYDAAIEQVNEILKTDPQNQTVKDRLQALENAKAGKAPVKNIEPTLP